MKPQATYQKLRGGYYTPSNIASFLSTWAVRSAGDIVLEPSCGDGAFLEATASRLLELGTAPQSLSSQIIGCEIDVREAQRAVDRLAELGIEKRNIQVYAGDFFSRTASKDGDWYFDAVVGNPPFVRYQNFPEEQRAYAFSVMRSTGLHPNRLTNAWVPFIVAAALRLKPKGRLAMVAPAELLQVNYAAELRLFLSKYFSQITVLTFRGLPFDGIQQEVVLLLASREDTSRSGIELLELNSSVDLLRYEPASFGRNGFKTIDHGTEKWTQYYLSQEEIELVRTLGTRPDIGRFGDVAETDIGVVTGMNDVFVLTEEQVRENRLENFARRLVSRSAHLPGILFRVADWRTNANAGQKVYLLDVPPSQERCEMPDGLERYLHSAESRNLHRGYKCRIRKRWYVVPSVYVPEAFMLRQIHHYPKLISNQGSATCTDTIHRVRFHRRTNRARCCAAFLNSLTFSFSEILGRSYGGGVLELEPNEANLLPLPLSGAGRLNPLEIDALVRANQIEKVLDITDEVLLAEGLGLSKDQIRVLRGIWIKLRNRRTGRRNEPTEKN